MDFGIQNEDNRRIHMADETALSIKVHLGLKLNQSSNDYDFNHD
jgi:hypothetical protein